MLVGIYRGFPCFAKFDVCALVKSYSRWIIEIYFVRRGEGGVLTSRKALLRELLVPADRKFFLNRWTVVFRDYRGRRIDEVAFCLAGADRDMVYLVKFDCDRL